MGATIENMISPNNVLCYIPPVLEIFGKKVKILEFTRKEATAPLISVAAPVWFWKKKIGFFLEIFESFGKLGIIISNVGGK